MKLKLVENSFRRHSKWNDSIDRNATLSKNNTQLNLNTPLGKFKYIQSKIGTTENINLESEFTTYQKLVDYVFSTYVQNEILTLGYDGLILNNTKLGSISTLDLELKQKLHNIKVCVFENFYCKELNGYYDLAALNLMNIEAIILTANAAGYTKKIPAAIFDSLPNLKYIAIANNFSVIESHCFSDCANIIDIVGINNITLLGSYSFARNNKLKYVQLPKVEKVSQGLFKECETLEACYIPDGVIELKRYSFKDCDNLKLIYIPSSVEEIDLKDRDIVNRPVICCAENSIASEWAYNNNLKQIPIN